MEYRRNWIGFVFMTGALVAAGCVAPYEPPREDQPHAVVKYRRIYQKRPGPMLREKLSIEEHPALSRTLRSSLAEGPQAGAVLAHPRPAKLEASAYFFHTETRMVTESFAERVPYTEMEMQTCGYGDNTYSCMRSVTKYRTEYKTRQVMKQVEVVDGRCETETFLAPREGATYLLELTYQDNRICRLSCYEQTTQGADGFENSPCPQPSAEQIAELTRGDEIKTRPKRIRGG